MKGERYIRILQQAANLAYKDKPVHRVNRIQQFDYEIPCETIEEAHRIESNLMRKQRAFAPTFDNIKIEFRQRQGKLTLVLWRSYMKVERDPEALKRKR